MNVAHRRARRNETAGNECSESTGNEAVQRAGSEGTQRAGSEGTQRAGSEGTQRAGNEGTQRAGNEGTQRAGSAGTQRARDGRPMGRKLVGELLRASARIAVSRNALLIGFGVTGPRLRLMKTIRRKREPRTVSQLARAIGVSRQTLQATVRDLVKVGFLDLEQNEYDRRASIVMLTPDGESCLNRLLEVERRWVADLTRGFDERLLAQTEWVVRCLRERLSD